MSTSKEDLLSSSSETVSTVLSTQESLSTQNSDNCVDSEGKRSVEPVLTEGAVVKKNKGGRPKKSAIQAKLKPGKRGRPVGDYTKARELCARMLVSEGDRMLQTLIRMALTEGHPNQMAALKMCLDRSLPLSYFESKDSTNPAGSGIVINISGLSAPKIESSDDEDGVIDV